MKTETVIIIMGIMYIIGLLLNRTMIKDVQKQQTINNEYREELETYHEELKRYKNALDERNSLIYRQYRTIAEILGIKEE